MRSASLIITSAFALSWAAMALSKSNRLTAFWRYSGWMRAKSCLAFSASALLLFSWAFAFWTRAL